MNRPDREAIVPPGGERDYRDLQVPEVFRVGRTLYLSGHVGNIPEGELPQDPREQIRAAFLDITGSLAAAGATWADVVSGTSYHVRMRDHVEAFLEVHREFVQEPYPAWTAVGVTELYSPRAIVEIAVVAVLPDIRD